MRERSIACFAVAAAAVMAFSTVSNKSAFADDVSLFTNNSFVDDSGGIGSEAANLRLSLNALGYTVSAFTGISAADWSNAGAGAEAIIIPEQERNTLISSLDPSARAAIRDYVENGGRLIVHGFGFGSRAGSLLNGIFGYSLSNAGIDQSGAVNNTLNSSAASGTSFAGGPAGLASLNGTEFYATSSLPAGSLNIYSRSATQSTVYVVPQGGGAVVYLGWDWFGRSLFGSRVDSWDSVLDRAIKFETDADGDGVPDGDDLCADTASGDAVDSNGCSVAQVDGDGDGICDPGAASGGPSGCSGTDNCPFTPNASQADLNGDGVGDACDADDIQALCADATVPADGSCQAAANIDAGSFDPDGDAVSTAQDPSGPYGLGSTNVTLNVDDIVSVGPDDAPAMCMAAVTVVDDTAPDVTASLIPVGAGDEVDDDDEGRFQISFSATDNCADDVTASCTAVLDSPGCASIAVVNGQVIEFEVEDDECETELEDGLWEIEGPDLTLTVNCGDPAGNIGTATAMAEGLAGDNDGVGDLDD